MPTETTPEPNWTEAEHEEILRLHIIDGLTITDAMWEVIAKRPSVQSKIEIVRSDP